MAKNRFFFSALAFLPRDQFVLKHKLKRPAKTGNKLPKILIPKWDHASIGMMRIISRKTLKEFWIKHPQAERPLRAWFADAKHANWKTPSTIKEIYKNASILPNSRVVFNIKGNDYRLITAINYDLGIIYIRFIGTHAEYDKIDAKTI